MSVIRSILKSGVITAERNHKKPWNQAYCINAVFSRFDVSIWKKVKIFDDLPKHVTAYYKVGDDEKIYLWPGLFMNSEKILNNSELTEN